MKQKGQQKGGVLPDAAVATSPDGRYKFKVETVRVCQMECVNCRDTESREYGVEVLRYVVESVADSLFLRLIPCY